MAHEHHDEAFITLTVRRLVVPGKEPEFDEAQTAASSTATIQQQQQKQQQQQQQQQQQHNKIKTVRRIAERAN